MAVNEKELQKELAEDVYGAAGGKVVYLEGKTDVPILLGLLGAQGEQEVTGGVLYGGALIRGLRDRRGSGSTAVQQRIAFAQRHGIRGILGVLDGDGESLVSLASDFDPPHAGPQFRWKTYCIENLLVRAGWPGVWGPAPDWRAVMDSYAPYVAINRLELELLVRLKRVGLGQYVRPGSTQASWTAAEVLQRLRAVKHELMGLDVEDMFSTELAHFKAALAVSVDEAHALLNGKWLVDVFAAKHTRTTPEVCRVEWAQHLREIGGDPEIKGWWRRVVAPRP